MIEKATSYRFKVYDKIKEDIITGQYSQGEILNERKLSDLLGVSRTPIREALQLLDADGWVVYEPYKGTIVRTFDPDYYKSVFNVRRVLEILVVEEAVRNITDSDIHSLELIINEQNKLLSAVNEDEFMKLDSRFHEEIYKISKNKIAKEILDKFRDIIRFYGIRSLKINSRRADTFDEHYDIFKSIIKRDVAQAKNAMEHHMFKAEELISSTIRKEISR